MTEPNPNTRAVECIGETKSIFKLETVVMADLDRDFSKCTKFGHVKEYVAPGKNND